MKSNGWKLFVVAPIALTLLSACGGGKNKKDNGYYSPYAGAWLEEQAAVDYIDGMRDGSFCARVQTNASFHGIRQNQSPVMHAWMIQNDGRVNYWSRTTVRTNVTNVAGIGQVGPDGLMAPYMRTSVTQQVNTQQMWTFRRTSDTIMLITRPRMERRADGRMFPRSETTRFVRMSTQQLEDYSAQFVSCTGQEFEDRSLYGYRAAQGVQPFDAFDGPPGAAFGGQAGGVVERYDEEREESAQDGGPIDPRLEPRAGQLPPQTPRPLVRK